MLPRIDDQLVCDGDQPALVQPWEPTDPSACPPRINSEFVPRNGLKEAPVTKVPPCGSQPVWEGPQLEPDNDL